MEFQGKNILAVGAGISGFAAAKVAKKFGAKVTLSDAKDEDKIEGDLESLRQAGINLKFGPQGESLLEDVDALILSPAVPVKIPLVEAAYKKNISVISEVEMAYEFAKSPIAAVTGTNGKTTTTTLLGKLLEARYDKVGVGGNIGVPLVDEVLRVGEGGAIAAEISSYQMEATNHFRPHVTAVLNVTPDHLKRHGTMEVYQAMKEKLFAEETEEDFVVLNYDDEKVRSMSERTKAQVYYFSRRETFDKGAFLQNNTLSIADGGKVYELVSVEELGIKGAHNVENALAAAMSAYLMGVSIEKMIPVLKDFKGVEHRIEFVREIEGVPYYNDSKATNTDSAIKALETFDGHIILIAGGDDKGTDLTEFMTLVKAKVDELILVGDAAKRFEEVALKIGTPPKHIHLVGYDMKKAVKTAKELAKPPQIVLLSPACASFDMYKGFEARGKDFKEIVNGL
ncbi:MAG: UDP-N-acetylmuramoyl-L-alanine--D-glutamate ligase [Selenomonadaceae bacterium]|nr:UDP-N-acetylmuramoyl-L-alanine--D-glutamate ligase [Selenomonadaceae bacterium]